MEKFKNIVIIVCTVLLGGLMLFSIFSCENANDVQKDIQKLRAERNELNEQLSNLKYNKRIVEEKLVILTEETKELEIYKTGNRPQYIITIHLQQSHFSLDIGKHMKDKMNAIDFEIPVSKEFYDSVDEDTKIVDEFRTGSFILEGSLGDWKMTVKNKEIR